MPRNVNIAKATDWTIVLVYMGLVFIGWLNIYAAVFDAEHQNILDISQRYGKQLLWILAAFLIAFVFMSVESNAFTYLAYIIYGIVIFLLFSVLIFGREVNATRAWFEIGSFRLQPAEFGKFATALALSRFMGTYNFRLGKFKNFLTSALIICFPVLLILLQPDVGSAIIYVSLIFVFYREGMHGIILLFSFIMILIFVLTIIFSVSFNNITMLLIGISFVFMIIFSFMIKEWRRIFHSIIALVAIGLPAYLANYFFFHIKTIWVVFICIFIYGIFVLIYSFRNRIKLVWLAVVFLWISTIYIQSIEYIYYKVLEPYHRFRIESLLGLKVDKKGIDYNVSQSMIAIGSGGFAGKGYLNGTQTKYNFVPENATDFIFCTVGEEWGFIGSLIVVGLFTLLITRIIFLAERQKSVFSRVYGYCVASLFFIHVTINIGMTIGLMPVIGIPLPFFSYGGSSLWAFTMLLFTFVRLDAARNELL